MLDFDAIVADLKKHEQKFPGFVHCFNWSDSREAKDQYGAKLREYGIIQQEWRDNILKINKEEAGLKSFFEDAKTGQTLLKRKILPTIESRLEEQISDKVDLQTLFRKHAVLEVKNKKIIEDEKLYRAFLRESDTFISDAYTLHETKEAYTSANQHVGSVIEGMAIEQKRIDVQYHNAEEEKRENRREMDRIKYEEECFFIL